MIVKSNYNNRAIDGGSSITGSPPASGRPLPHPGITRGGQYYVLELLCEVSEEIWADPSLVVEKFRRRAG